MERSSFAGVHPSALAIPCRKREEGGLQPFLTEEEPLPFAAVISASANIGHDEEQLRATLVFAGQTLVEYQARQAFEAGAGHISIHVGAITPALTRSVDRLVADGINVSLVRSPSELRQTVPPDTGILLIGDGIIAAQSCYEALVRRAAPSLLVVNDHVTDPPFERIDAQHRWAGLALLGPLELAAALQTLDMLADWDLPSVLLRHAVQSRPERLIVSDEALFKGDVVMVANQAAADAAETHFLPMPVQSSSGEGWVEHYLLQPVAGPLAAIVLRQQVDIGFIRSGAICSALIALIVAAYGLTWPALLLFLMALMAEKLANGIARVARRPGGKGWRDALVPALAILGLTVLGGHWTVGKLSGDLGGFHLAAVVLIVEAAVRRGKTAGLSPWLVCSLPTALLVLLLFRFAGALDLGFALIILYALGSIGLLLFRVGPEPRTAS